MRFLNISADSVKKLSSSSFNYWFGYPVNLSLVVWLASRAFVGGHSMLGLNEWFVCWAGGLLLWTVSEYVLHRYVYHIVESALRLGHEMHHDEPKALLGVPWYLTTLALVAVYYLLSAAFNPARTGVVMAALWLGYIGYCALHHSIHHFEFENAWFRRLRRYHLIHHVHPDYNWGITTTFWDVIFRTRRE